MKILHHRNTWKSYLHYGEDYLHDMIIHGLRQLEEVETTDYPVSRAMYKVAWETGEVERQHMYGKGFSLYNTLDEVDIDRCDLQNKIKNNYFDLIILGSFNHEAKETGSPLPVLDELIYEHTPANKIVIVDGDDHTNIQPLHQNYRYFKRELVSPRKNVMPISFAIPESCIQQPIEKVRALAGLIPGDGSTYVYNTEKEYYEGYGSALFGITYKKGGWDCLRHYEILACNTVPWFKDIDQCPDLTLTTLPKQLLKLTNNMIDKYTPIEFMHGAKREMYEQVQHQMLKHFRQYCTTQALGKYIIENSIMQN